jgi:hypothetical protein
LPQVGTVDGEPFSDLIRTVKGGSGRLKARRGTCLQAIPDSEIIFRVSFGLLGSIVRLEIINSDGVAGLAELAGKEGFLVAGPDLN